jgi:hypothetical protein
MNPFVNSALTVVALVLPVAPPADTPFSGVITSIDGKSTLTVRDNRGALERVTLHKGTIINPTGLRLVPGTPVIVIGHANGGAYDADTVDAPLAAATPATQPIDRRTFGRGPVPPDVPDGTFETGGPSAEGGG